MWRTSTTAVEHDAGVDVHTHLYDDDEGKYLASRVAGPFYARGYAPVRVFAVSGELLLKATGTD